MVHQGLMQLLFTVTNIILMAENIIIFSIQPQEILAIKLLWRNIGGTNGL